MCCASVSAAALSCQYAWRRVLRSADAMLRGIIHARVCLVDLLCGSRRQKESAKPMAITTMGTDFLDSKMRQRIGIMSHGPSSMLASALGEPNCLEPSCDATNAVGHLLPGCTILEPGVMCMTYGRQRSIRSILPTILPTSHVLGQMEVPFVCFVASTFANPLLFTFA